MKIVKIKQSSQSKKVKCIKNLKSQQLQRHFITNILYYNKSIHKKSRIFRFPRAKQQNASNIKGNQSLLETCFNL